MTAELHSALMDGDDTQAAAAPDDTQGAAAPDDTRTVISPDAGPTQDVELAWSRDDDDDAPTERHTWRTTAVIALCMAVLAGGIGVGLWVWLREGGAGSGVPTVSAVAPPPAMPQDKDARFLALMGHQGWNMAIADPVEMTNGAHTVCNRMAEGESVPDLVHDIMIGPDPVTLTHATAFVDTAINIYCPASPAPPPVTVTATR